MKKFLLTPILALLIMAGSALKAQDRADDYLGLPGDNLNLYAVMNLFQECKTLEEFERRLNDEDSRINNLDLNGDNVVDYISVNDHVDGNLHTIVMQVSLGPNEKQDVGVFTVERLRDGSVQIQLVGDEALYGRNYVIEPIYDETPNPGYSGNIDNVQPVRTTYVEVATWPLVRFIYDPFYTGWHSSWYWGYYPEYWHPWSPCFYHFYYGYQYNWFPVYYSHYRHWDHIRFSHYNDYYYNRVRSYSPTVVVNINKGNYRQTYSRPESRRDGEALYARTHSERSSNISRREGSVNSGNSRRIDSGNSVIRNNNSRSTERVSSSRPSRESVSTSRSSRSTGNASRSSRESVNTTRSNRESGAVRSSGRSGNSGNAKPSRETRSSRSSREVSTSPKSSSRENMTMSRSYGSESRSYSSPSLSRSQSSRSTASAQRAPSYESRSIARSSAPSRSYEARSSSAPSRSYEARSSSAPSRSYQARSSSSAPSRSYSSGSVSRSSAPRQSSASVRSSGSRSSGGSSRTTSSSHSSGSSDNGRPRR